MNEIVGKVTRIALGIWLRRWIVLAVAWPVAIVLGFVVMNVPDRFEATAKVFVNTQTVLKPLMTGLTFQPDIDQQVSMLARTLISRPNVERLLETPGIGLNTSSPQLRDREIERLMLAIKVAPATNNLYAISYKDTDPQRSQRVVQGLVELFVDSGVGDKRRDSEEARRFIEDQIKTYEVKLTEAENRLKDFKLKNFGVVGTSNQDYFSRVSTLSDEVAKLRVDLASAEQGRDALKRELANEDPQLPVDASLPAAPQSETDVRLEAQKRQLDELLRRYTDEHPDVVGTRRTILQLERQKQQEYAAAKASGKLKGGAAATSPVYQQIRISLATAEANVASLRSQLAVQQGRLDQVRATAGKVPQAEADLAQLNRDYDILRKNYDQLVSRRESASLGVKLDQSAQLADFRIVEPPRVDPKAAFPNRQVLAAMTLIVSLAIGLGVSFGLGQAFPTFHDQTELREISGRPVLGSVSMYVSPASKLAERRDLMAFAGVAGLLVLSHVVWIGWITLHARA